MSSPLASVARGLRNYAAHVGEFKPNARLFLMGSFCFGIGLTTTDVVFNFYLVSLGLRSDAVGQLAGLGQGTIFLAALPAGVISERVGRKRALIAALLMIAAAYAAAALLASPALAAGIVVMYGAGLALTYVSLAPFMIANSSPRERTYLFSMNQAVTVGAGVLGNVIGGNVPALAASLAGFAPTSTAAYQVSMAVAAALILLGLVPLAGLRADSDPGARVVRATLSGVRSDAAMIFKVLFPVMLAGLGAGLLIPFNNLFVRTRFGLSDGQVGTAFSLMSLLGGAAVITGPVLAQRMGKLRAANLLNGISVIMIGLTAFSPVPALGLLAFMLRPAMTQSAGPLLDAFSMEAVSEASRATVASLNQMVWTVGVVTGALISGHAQLDYGWEVILTGMMLIYIVVVSFRYFVLQRHLPPRAN